MISQFDYIRALFYKYDLQYLCLFFNADCRVRSSFLRVLLGQSEDAYVDCGCSLLRAEHPVERLLLQPRLTGKGERRDQKKGYEGDREKEMGVVGTG